MMFSKSFEITGDDFFLKLNAYRSPHLTDESYFGSLIRDFLYHNWGWICRNPDSKIIFSLMNFSLSPRSGHYGLDSNFVLFMKTRKRHPTVHHSWVHQESYLIKNATRPNRQLLREKYQFFLATLAIHLKYHSYLI